MTLTSPKTLNISIIIPTFNEEGLLRDQLSFLGVYSELEVIVADGGSTDRTLEIANSFNVRVVHSSPGRGLQQNAGAEVAAADTLLFLHCDSRLPENFPEIIHTTLDSSGIVAGAFQLKIDAKGCAYSFIAWGANMRSRLLGLPYGDQALFVRKKHYQQAGGFPDQSLLEDLELVRRLKRFGNIKIAPWFVTTSARRWQQNGVLKTAMLNQFILLAYLFGVDATRLYRLYYGNATVNKGS